MARETHTDCRSEEGVTVGLIDALISICRVLAKRDLRSSQVVDEALLDLEQDYDHQMVMNAANDASQRHHLGL